MMSSHLGSCSAVDLRISPQELKVPVKSCRRRLGGQFLEQNDKQLPDDNHQILKHMKDELMWNDDIDDLWINVTWEIKHGQWMFLFPQNGMFHSKSKKESRIVVSISLGEPTYSWSHFELWLFPRFAGIHRDFPVSWLSMGDILLPDSFDLIGTSSYLLL